jgi:hypothetical protein
MSKEIEPEPSPSSPPEMGADGRKGGRGVHRLVFLASAGLLALSLGHFVYHYVLVTEAGYRLLGYVGLH